MTPDVLLAFDVNETLLDLSVLDEPFENAFGAASLTGIRPLFDDALSDQPELVVPDSSGLAEDLAA